MRSAKQTCQMLKKNAIVDNFVENFIYMNVDNFCFLL